MCATLDTFGVHSGGFQQGTSIAELFIHWEREGCLTQPRKAEVWATHPFELGNELNRLRAFKLVPKQWQREIKNSWVLEMMSQKEKPSLIFKSRCLLINWVDTPWGSTEGLQGGVHTPKPERKQPKAARARDQNQAMGGWDRRAGLGAGASWLVPSPQQNRKGHGWHLGHL